MQSITSSARRFEPSGCWANRILRIDLSTMEAQVQESEPYLPDSMGARGFTKLCWDAYAEPVAASDFANPLMVVPGAATGSRSPYGAERVDAPLLLRCIHIGDTWVLDPHSGCQAKACVGHRHTLRAVIKDCVSVDDLCFALVTDWDAPDYRYLFRDISGIGDTEGLSVEYHLFKAVNGIDWSERAFGQATERIYTLERALQVRHWGRDRQTDEKVLPYFE